jgi:hypothetical protein
MRRAVAKSLRNSQAFPIEDKRASTLRMTPIQDTSITLADRKYLF